MMGDAAPVSGHDARRRGGPAEPSPGGPAPALAALLPFLLAGIYFGVVLTRSEVVSWFRIQEMFRFQSFHMYGILGSAVAVAALSLWVMRRAGRAELVDRAMGTGPEADPDESAPVGPRHWLGGALFGVGWALVGACPGPIYALIGSGVTVMVVALLAAATGAWAYGMLRPRLPH